MINEDTIAIWIVVIGCCGTVVFCFGGCAGERLGVKNQREQAISAGVAEWYLDANAEKAFRWKTNHFEK